MQNNKKYWLRGGIMGLCIAMAIILLFYLPTGMTYESIGLLDEITALYMLIYSLFETLYGCDAWYPLDTQNLTKCPDYIGDAAMILFIISFILFNVLASSFLGWIYGKIKNRNRI
jgi:hypothetical protein